MEYASEVWDGCGLDVKNNLEKLQLEAGRIVTGLPIFASRESIYYETGWELLEDRRRFKRLNMFYSIHNQQCPQYLSDLMPHLITRVRRISYATVPIKPYPASD